MPGMPLAKGDPFYKAKDFQEVGVVKTWELADNVHVTGDFRVQFILNQVENIMHLNVGWSGTFPLFEDYFQKHKSHRGDPPPDYWPKQPN